MTLVKLNRGNRSNGSSLSPVNHSNMPLINSEVGAVLPRLFDTFTTPFLTRDFIQDFLDDTVNLGTGAIGTTLPAVNISETETDLVIEVAAPGMNKKDFKVEITDDQLHIGYKTELTTESNNHWRREYNFESFDRTFTLPSIVEGEKVAATYVDGILRIAVPKKEEARRKPAKAVEIK